MFQSSIIFIAFLASSMLDYMVARSSAKTKGMILASSRSSIRSFIIIMNRVGERTPPYITPLPMLTV